MDTHNQEETVYQLVFQGPKDARAETLRSLRGALIGDMNIDLERAKFLLENAPVTFNESENRELLTPQLQQLEKAGAQALIVRSTKVQERRQSKAQEPTSRPTPIRKKTDLKLLRPVRSEDLALPEDLDIDTLLDEQEVSDGDLSLKTKEVTDEHHPQVDAFFQRLQKTAVLDKDRQPLVAPLAEIQRGSLSGQEKKASAKVGRWTQYRDWITDTDVKFRIILNEEMVAGTIISCFLTILVCAFLIPLELHTRSQYSEQERKVGGFVNTYADLLVYGEGVSPEDTEKR
ncbi:hypothetical protein MRY87_11145 [bacterium]|nr:hypothetical protein [bacterium]